MVTSIGEIILRHATKIEQLSALEGTTALVNLSVGIVYCGTTTPTTNHLTINILHSDGGKSALYNDDATYAMFKVGDAFQLMNIEEMRELVKTQLKDKKFSDKLKLGHLTKLTDGSINGVIELPI
jgi:hypothetical protein